MPNAHRSLRPLRALVAVGAMLSMEPGCKAKAFVHGETLRIDFEAPGPQAVQAAQTVFARRCEGLGLQPPRLERIQHRGAVTTFTLAILGVPPGQAEHVHHALAQPGRFSAHLAASGQTMATYPAREEALAKVGGTVPAGTLLLPVLAKQGKPGGWAFIEANAAWNETHLVSAQSKHDLKFESHLVHFQLDASGRQLNEALTGIAAEERRPLAIVFDGHVMSLLRCQEPIRGTAVEIRGSFTATEADDMALQLSSGPLPDGLRELPAAPISLNELHLRSTVPDSRKGMP